MFRNLMIANALDSSLTFNIVASDGADVLNIKINGAGALRVDWGDGSQVERIGVSATHTYAAAGVYTVGIAIEDASKTVSVIKLDNSTVNIRSSNERWGAIPGLSVLSCNGCANSELAFATLPDGADTAYSYASAFFSCANALLPVRQLPSYTTSIASLAYNCSKALLPFSELPPNLKGAQGNAFYNCTAATFTVTRIPDGVTGLNNAFYYCSKANIKLTALPANLTSMSLGFAYSGLVMDLDEVVANAPAGGFAALTNLSSAFTGCAGVTGSRSRFLAACPNATTNNYTFTGTSTTE